MLRIVRRTLSTAGLPRAASDVRGDGLRVSVAAHGLANALGSDHLAELLRRVADQVGVPGGARGRRAREPEQRREFTEVLAGSAGVDEFLATFGTPAEQSSAGTIKERVYKFLDAQAKNLGSWDSSPIWKIVDGPMKLTKFTTSGQVTLEPNPDYSGTPKATVKVVELPFT